MPIDFFETELRKLQERFNQTFGTMTVCNQEARQVTILSIVGLGVLVKRIGRANTQSEVRQEIRDFMAGCKTLNEFFTQIETERSKSYVESSNNPRPVQVARSL